MDQNNKIETPEEPRQEPSESEKEREKVLFVLHNFYQERQKNTVVHKEISELIERAEPYLEKALPYFQNNIYKGYKNVGIVCEGNWGEGFEGQRLGIVGAHPQEETIFGRPKVYGHVDINIGTFLKELQEQEKYKDDAILEQAADNLKEIFTSLSDRHQKLWSQRESYAKALLSLIGKGWEKSELKHRNEGKYDLDGYIIAEKSVINKEGKESKESLYLNLDDWSCKKELEKIQKTYNISEGELKEISKLEWSLEEKQKLANLVKGVEIFKQGMEKAIPQESKDLSFTPKELELIKDAYVRGFARKLYEKSGLPSLHKERVIEEIMMDKLEYL